MDDLLKNRKVFTDASAAIASLTMKQIAHKAEGVRLQRAIDAATRDRDLSLAAIQAAEDEETAPAPAPEARTNLFMNGAPLSDQPDA